MTQEEKQLLLKDICARLPYGVICDMWFERNPEGKITEALKCGGLMRLMNNAFDFIAKPYLRPMSSMTEEEKQMMDNLWKDNNKLVFADPSEIRRYKFYDISVVDFLNSHHFDYRGLIEKGLALEAPKEMYDIKTK